MTDDRFDKALKEMAEEYNEPPVTPREEMWAQIQTLRLQRHRQQRSRLMRLGGWGVGIAAALAIGVGIGRRSQPETPVTPDTVMAFGETDDATGLYQFAATQHLAQVEVFLTMFQVDASSGRPVEESGVAATDLLSTTRLYLDSPASENAQLRNLLEDIELVLAQITQLTRDDTEELTLIDESIEQNGVLLRLQSVVGTDGRVGAQGAL
jgi:hypothetical protein